uniref:Uncharacterized protein n=1 Tax=Glossina brevipalpis TaxID=37001 RepID=A0A1A9WYF4_9MUSC
MVGRSTKVALTPFSELGIEGITLDACKQNTTNRDNYTSSHKNCHSHLFKDADVDVTFNKMLNDKCIPFKLNLTFAVFCSVLQCFAVLCSALQCFAVLSSVFVFTKYL